MKKVEKNRFFRDLAIIFLGMALGVIFGVFILDSDNAPNLDIIDELSDAIDVLAVEKVGLKKELTHLNLEVEKLENKKNEINEKYKKIRASGGYGPFFMDSIRATNRKYARYYGN